MQHEMQHEKEETMDIEDLIDLFISERTTVYLHNHTDASRKEYDMNDQWMELLKEKAPDLAESYQDHLESLTELQGDSETSLYLFGLADGLRIARYLEDIII